MTVSDLDRFTVTAADDAFVVHIRLGEVEVDVKLPSLPGYDELTNAQRRTALLRQARRALEVAREELDDGAP